MVVAVGAALIVRQLTGGSVWTGVVFNLPPCPMGAEGCRAFVVPAADLQTVSPVVAHADWSGSSTTSDVSVPAGSYAVILEGCTGYERFQSAVAVTAGTHPTVDFPGDGWELPAFARTCPGFHPVAGSAVGP